MLIFLVWFSSVVQILVSLLSILVRIYFFLSVSLFFGSLSIVVVQNIPIHTLFDSPFLLSLKKVEKVRKKPPNRLNLPVVTCLELRTQNQFILGYSVHQNPTDTRCLAPHFEQLKAQGFPSCLRTSSLNPLATSITTIWTWLVSQPLNSSRLFRLADPAGHR